MRRAVGVELARWRSRGVVVWLVGAALLLAVVAAGLVAWDSRPLTAADQRDAAAQSALAGRDPDVRAEVADCAADPSAYFGPGSTTDDCRANLLPGPDRFLPRERLDLAGVVTERGADVAIVLAALMVVAGASFAGADWSSRSMLTQLGVQPRRLRLWGAKALAVVIGSALATFLALLGFWAVLGIVAELRGLDPGSGAVVAALEQVGRAVVLASAAALGGFALTMALRRTVATLALLFVYAVGGELLLGLAPFEDAARWSVGRNALAWIDAARDGAPGVTPYWQSGAFLGGLTLVAVLFSVVVFTRRDA